MPVFTVEHVTTYRYRRPVGFGAHRLMGRPRDTADQRLLDWSVEVSPKADDVHSVQDAFGNLITWISIAGRAEELRIVNRLRVAHSAIVPDEARLADYARTWPFSYSAEDIADLARAREPALPDPGHDVARWARRFLDGVSTPTLDLLSAMTQAIRADFTYRARYEEGVQAPERTLALQSGTCRDFAVLMMEAVRSLGFAARFVTGYLYVPRGPDVSIHFGGGATHAWVEVFLPGLGWVDFDPTNAIVGSRDLIRVASVREWRQAIPLGGTWTGFPSDSLGMEVSVEITRNDDQGDGNARILPISGAVSGAVSGRRQRAG